MTNDKKYDLEARTLKFAKECINLGKNLEKNIVNQELLGQFIRSAGSVGANYREANEASTKKDFYYRISLCRKEAKETCYWLELILHANVLLQQKLDTLIDEARQLTRIFSSIALKNL